MQRIFRPIFNATDLKTDGSDFDHLFRDGEQFNIGELSVETLHTPGHTQRTSATRSMMPSSSATRCSCRITAPRARIFRVVTPTSSIARSRGCSRCPRNALFMCHDYKAPGRDVYAWETTVRQQRDKNVHVGGGKTKPNSSRCGRPATPRCRANAAVAFNPGQHPRWCVPPAEDNGVRYLKIPVTFKADRKAGARRLIPLDWYKADLSHCPFEGLRETDYDILALKKEFGHELHT